MKNKKNKKWFIIALIIIVLLAVGFGGYYFYSSFLFCEDGTLVDGHNDLLEHLKGIEDKEERKKQIDFSLESNIITKEEADELYEY